MSAPAELEAVARRLLNLYDHHTPRRDTTDEMQAIMSEMRDALGPPLPALTVLGCALEFAPPDAGEDFYAATPLGRVLFEEGGNQSWLWVWQMDGYEVQQLADTEFRTLEEAVADVQLFLDRVVKYARKIEYVPPTA